MKMKKLMKMVCGAMVALSSTAFGLTASPCLSCGEGVGGCQVWFKGSGSGKISCGVASQTYKKVSSLSVKNCQLVIFDDGSNTTAKVVLTAKKKGVGDSTVELECSEFKWNVFGKKTGNEKKSYKLDSEIFFLASDDAGTTVVNGVLFGTVKVKNAGNSCAPCGEGFTTSYTPGSFKGKYVGYAPASGCACADELEVELDECTSCGGGSCLKFVEQSGEKMEYFCGDITLKYNAKSSGCK